MLAPDQLPVLPEAFRRAFLWQLRTRPMVCFAVYPGTASKALVSAFHAFDDALATAMGVELYRRQGNDDGYEIAAVQAQDWWDDGVWDQDQQDATTIAAPVRKATTPGSDSAP